MSKIIKYNDYVQISPDQRILTLDKSDKIQLIDNMLERSYNGGKGLVITYDLSHSGRRINNRIYSTRGQQRGIDSLTTPYPKPILKNHDQSGEPIGRFIGGEWQNLYDDAKEFLQSSQAVLDIHNAFAGDDPERIYNTLKAMNLIENKQWPGLGRMRVQANITDEEAIKKFMDGRYLTFSAGSTTDRHVCSICKADWAKDGMCEHRHGKTYDEEICVFITGEFAVLEGSVVNTPADDLSQLVHMEMRDSLDEKELITDKEIFLEEFILTDSVYNLGEENETERIQKTEQVDAYKEETKKEENAKEVSKRFDHQMTISESAMMELHKKGETYITQKDDKQTMVIKVNYSGSMREDSLGDIYQSFEEEVNELVEELIDEKSFKVPAGAKGNAQKVLNWKKEKGSEVKGMTPVGWARARQLATKSEIGLSTVKRMSAFNRHRKNSAVDPKFKSEPWKDRGYVAWLGWGGTSGIDWAIKVSAANDSLYTGVSEEEKEIFRTPLSEMIGDFDLDIACNKNKDSSLNNCTKEPTMKNEDIDPTIPSQLDTDATSDSSSPQEKVVEASEEVELDNAIELPINENQVSEDDTADTLDAEDSVDIDWEFLDIAMQGYLLQEGVRLSTEERDALPDSAFCGPERAFPIVDCAHVTAAKQLITKLSFNNQTKTKLTLAIDEKAKEFSCDKSEDFLNLEMQFKELQSQYVDLENKFKTVLESMVEKKKEKSIETVEIKTNDALTEDNVDILNKSIESPSEHTENNVIGSKKETKLPIFEQRIVDKYKEIQSSLGDYLATVYLDSKKPYLPKGFNPKNF